MLRFVTTKSKEMLNVSNEKQSSQDDELTKLVDEKDSKNTIKANQNAVSLFETYLIENGHVKTNGDDHCADLKPIDWAVMNSSDLDLILYRFYAETRNLKGEKYKKTTMLSIRGGLNRHMNMIRRHKKMEEIDLARDPQFTESNSMFKAVGKVLKSEGKASIDHHPPVELDDLKKIRNYFIENIENPAILQQAVFVYVVMFFIKMGRENLRQLKVNEFAVTSDADGDLYLYKNTDELIKNHEDDANKKEARMYQKKDNEVLCPVKTFVNYTRKLNPGCIYLFQRPRREITTQDTVWYDASSVGLKWLGSMMPRISTAAHLSKIYTNHSLRATTITLQDDAKQLLCYWPPEDAKTNIEVCEIPNKEDCKKNSVRMIGESCQIEKTNFKEYPANVPTHLSSQYILPTDEIQLLNSKDHLESQGCISSTNIDVSSGSSMRFHSNLENDNPSKENQDCSRKCCSKVLSKLENLEAMLLDMRNELFKKNQGNIDSSFTLQKILPGGKVFSTKEEFEAFDRQLNNELFSKKLIQLLSMLEGGQDVGKITRTIMRSVLSNSVMSFYSNVGQEEKLPFITTNFFQVVSKAIMKSCDENVEENEIISEIGAILKKAPNQPGGINYNKKREMEEERNKRLKTDHEYLPLTIVKHES